MPSGHLVRSKGGPTSDSRKAYYCIVTKACVNFNLIFRISEKEKENSILVEGQYYVALLSMGLILMDNQHHLK